MDYSDWVEELENSVFLYFSEDLPDFEDYLEIDTYLYYEKGHSVDSVVEQMRTLLEEKDYGPAQ